MDSSSGSGDAFTPPVISTYSPSEIDEGLHLSENRVGIESALVKLIETDNEVIAALIDLLYDVNQHAQNLQRVKTAGTSFGALGTTAMLAGVCLIPFTGGSSVALASSALSIGGFATTALSGVAAQGSYFYNRSRSRQFVERLKALEVKQKGVTQQLTQQLGFIHHVVQGVTASSGVSEDVALKATIQCVTDRVLDFVKNEDGFISVASGIQSVIHRIQLIQNLAISAAGIQIGEYSLVTVASEASQTIGKAAARFGEITSAELKGVRDLIRSSGDAVKPGLASGKTLMKGIGAAAGVIFTVIDVTLLIRDWNKRHPVVSEITKTVSELQKDIEKSEDLLKLVKRINSEAEDNSTEVD